MSDDEQTLEDLERWEKENTLWEVTRVLQGYGTEYMMSSERAVEKMLEHVQQLEEEVEEQCRFNGMGAQRELKLMTEVKNLETRIEKFRDALQQIKVDWEYSEPTAVDIYQIVINTLDEDDEMVENK